MAKLINGKKLAKQINERTKSKVSKLKKQGITPCLVVMYVGDDPASALYIKMKDSKAHLLGIRTIVHHFSNDISQDELLNWIHKYNQDEKVDGIMVQTPLPSQINENSIASMIRPNKDVDGFHPINMGKLFLDGPDYYPVSCTPKGIMSMLKAYQIPLRGKRAVIIGRSSIVGRPMAGLMINARASVTILNHASENLDKIIKQADIIISATGQLNLIHAQNVKEDATIIDVGENHDENGRLVGDVDFPNVKEHAGYISPVPGGVGPMTIATLMQQITEMTEQEIANQ